MTGLARAINERKLNSTTGINGWVRHGLVIIITCIVSYFAVELNAVWFSYAFAVGFIIEYVISIAENWHLMGYKLPDNIINMLDKLNAPEFKELNLKIKHDKNDDDKLKELGKRMVDNDYDEHKIQIEGDTDKYE